MKYYKVSENKVIKVEDDKQTKIILRLEPFVIEELELHEIETENFNYLRFNQVHEYNIDTLEEISEEEIAIMFIEYIQEFYKKERLKQKEEIKVLEEEKDIINLLDISYEEYAVGHICFGERYDYAVKINNKWYNYSHEKEEFSEYDEYKPLVVEEYFKICSKEEFLKHYKKECLFFKNKIILKKNEKIIKYEKEELELLGVDFPFIIN